MTHDWDVTPQRGTASLCASSDNDQERRVMDFFYKSGSLDLCHPPAVNSTCWSHAAKTGRESVDSARKEEEDERRRWVGGANKRGGREGEERREKEERR